MKFTKRLAAKVAVGGVLFGAGVFAGNWHGQSVTAQNKFGQPKSVIHFVVYKWKNTTSQNDKEQALAGITAMAAKIRGIKNIWLKTQRNQIRYLAEDAAQPDPRFRRGIRHRIRQPGSGCRLRREPAARNVAEALGRAAGKQLVLRGFQPLEARRGQVRFSRTMP